MSTLLKNISLGLNYKLNYKLKPSNFFSITHSSSHVQFTPCSFHGPYLCALSWREAMCLRHVDKDFSKIKT